VESIEIHADRGLPPPEPLQAISGGQALTGDCERFRTAPDTVSIYLWDSSQRQGRMEVNTGSVRGQQFAPFADLARIPERTGEGRQTATTATLRTNRSKSYTRHARSPR